MDEGAALHAQWRWTEFIQHKEEVGKPIKHVQSEVPLATPVGIRYVPGGPDYYARESVSTGPPPLDQLVDFLTWRTNGDRAPSSTTTKPTAGGARRPM
jgi:hypothetical protein